MDIMETLFGGFKSAKQRQKEQKDFEARVFPLGMGQRDAAAAVLAELLPHHKHDVDRLFAFISAKDAYTQEDDVQDAERQARHVLQGMRWRNQADVEMVMALLHLDLRASSLEEYPTAKQVRDAAILTE